MASGSVIRNLALKKVVTDYTASSADATYNETLSDGGYLIFVYALNSTQIDNFGVYLASMHSNNSSVAPILESNVTTLTANHSVLTIHVTKAWTYVKIFRIP